MGPQRENGPDGDNYLYKIWRFVHVRKLLGLVENEQCFFLSPSIVYLELKCTETYYEVNKHRLLYFFYHFHFELMVNFFPSYTHQRSYCLILKFPNPNNFAVEDLYSFHSALLFSDTNLPLYDGFFTASTVFYFLGHSDQKTHPLRNPCVENPTDKMAKFSVPNTVVK